MAPDGSVLSRSVLSNGVIEEIAPFLLRAFPEQKSCLTK